MNMATGAVIAGIAVIAGVIICLSIISKILWRVYERGGAGDVKSFATALRDLYDPSWPGGAFRASAGPQRQEDDQDSDA